MSSSDRDHSIAWARSIMEGVYPNFVVIDTETTGLDSEAVVVQIGVVGSDGEVLLDTLINPQRSIPPGATRVHGITDADVAGAPIFASLVDQISVLLGDRTVLAYNARYDSRILFQSCKAILGAGCSLDWLTDVKFEDVMDTFASFYGDWNDYHQSYKWKKLTLAARHLGCLINNAHSAVTDAQMTLGVVKGMAAARLSNET